MKKVLSIICSLFIVFSSFTGNVGFAMDPPKKSANCEVEENNDVHIFCSADDGNAMPTCVSIASVLENAGDEKINIHIVSFQDNKMGEQNIKNIEALKNIRDFDFDFVYFDKTRLDEFETSGWNKSIMVKLYCAELFPNLDRIIWIDDDLIVLKSLKNLYNLDMGDKYLAAIEMYQKSRNSDRRWVNAGIGLYNLKEMRKDNVQKSLLDSAKEYAVGRSKITHARGGVEEYALTYGMPKDKVFVLPVEYALLIGFYSTTNVPCKMSDIVAMHFGNPNNKPWTNLNVFCAKKWYEYALKTNFFDKSAKDVGFKIDLLQKLDSKSTKNVEDGIYTISSKLDSNKCLDINHSSKEDKANLQLWQKNETDAQKFKIQYQAEGYYTIEAVCSGKFIDVSDSGKNKGTNIQQYNNSGTDAQKWFIVPDGEGYCLFLPKCNSLCMDVSNSKTNDGTNIWCWFLNLSDAQRFKLEKCEDKPSSSKPNKARKLAGKLRPNKPGDSKKSA